MKQELLSMLFQSVYYFININIYDNKKIEYITLPLDWISNI